MPTSSPVVFPSSIDDEPGILEKNCFIHYNILRHADEVLGKKPRQRFNGYSNFALDRPWASILAHPSPKQAIVLKVSHYVLLERMTQRRHIESKSLLSSFINRYPRQHWIEILEQINLDKIYQAWCYELEKNGIPYVLIDSSNDCYSVLGSSHDIHDCSAYHTTNSLTGLPFRQRTGNEIKPIEFPLYEQSDML
jgi:hypothetical protein